MKMRALTLWQPWAGLIALGLKTIETRGWKHLPITIIGEPLAIHASLKWRDRKAELLNEARGILHSYGLGELERRLSDEALAPCVAFGAIVCTAVLSAAWNGYGGKNTNQAALCDTDGRVCLALRDIARLDPPIPWKGKQGFFWVEV